MDSRYTLDKRRVLYFFTTFFLSSTSTLASVPTLLSFIWHESFHSFSHDVHCAFLREQVCGGACLQEQYAHFLHTRRWITLCVSIAGRRCSLYVHPLHHLPSLASISIDLHVLRSESVGSRSHHSNWLLGIYDLHADHCLIVQWYTRDSAG